CKWEGWKRRPPPGLPHLRWGRGRESVATLSDRAHPHPVAARPPSPRGRGCGEDLKEEDPLPASPICDGGGGEKALRRFRSSCVPSPGRCATTLSPGERVRRRPERGRPPPGLPHLRWGRGEADPPPAPSREQEGGRVAH